MYETFTQALNAKLSAKAPDDVKKLREVYSLQKFIGRMHREIRESIETKDLLIRVKLPLIIMESVGDVEESLAAIVDVWTYHNSISLSAKWL